MPTALAEGMVVLGGVSFIPVLSRITVTFSGPFSKELKFPFSVSDFDSSRVAKKTSNNDGRSILATRVWPVFAAWRL